jgi:hypothetical protein
MLDTLQSRTFEKLNNWNIQDYNLPVVLCGCEILSLTLRKEHKLRVFEIRTLRRIFGPKRDVATEGWRKLHNEELRDFYSSPSIIRIIKSREKMSAGYVARKGEMAIAYMLLVGKPEAKRPLGRPRCSWISNIKTDIIERG